MKLATVALEERLVGVITLDNLLTEILAAPSRPFCVSFQLPFVQL